MKSFWIICGVVFGVVLVLAIGSNYILSSTAVTVQQSKFDSDQVTQTQSRVESVKTQLAAIPQAQSDKLAAALPSSKALEGFIGWVASIAKAPGVTETVAQASDNSQGATTATAPTGSTTLSLTGTAPNSAAVSTFISSLEGGMYSVSVTNLSIYSNDGAKGATRFTAQIKLATNL